MVNKDYDLPNLDATADLAKKLAKSLQPGIVIFLIGELGAGKTTLVREILRALNYEGAIKSPTYTLVETYAIDNLTVHHFDLYRIADPSELEFIGIRDYVQSEAVCIFEWPQKGLGYVPQPDLEITLNFDKNARFAHLRTKSVKGEQIFAQCGE